MLKIELNPKSPVVGKTYRFHNSNVIDGDRGASWADITAPTPELALQHLGWKAEDIDIAKVWKCSGKIGESGQPTSGGWGKLVLPPPQEERKNEGGMLDATAKREKAATQRANLKAKKEKEQHEAFEKECRDNEAKGLTWAGYTKTFDGESISLYINNKKMVCTVSYDTCACPHMEFRGEATALTETGYRSHFLQVDLSQYETLRDAVADQVEYIIRNRYCQNSKAKYTLTWEPSLEYLKDNPEQLKLFEIKESNLCLKT